MFHNQTAFSQVRNIKVDRVCCRSLNSFCTAGSSFACKELCVRLNGRVYFFGWLHDQVLYWSKLKSCGENHIPLVYHVVFRVPDASFSLHITSSLSQWRLELPDFPTVTLITKVFKLKLSFSWSKTFKFSILNSFATYFNSRSITGGFGTIWDDPNSRVMMKCTFRFFSSKTIDHIHTSNKD